MKPYNTKQKISLSFPTCLPAEASAKEGSGIQNSHHLHRTLWIPAFAGMTTVVVLIVLIFFGIMLSVPVHAQNFAQQPCYSDRGGYCIKIVASKLPSAPERSGFAIVGLEFLGESANLGDLLANIYYFLLGLVGISALVMFVWGGIEYMLAGDKDPSKAKDRMKNAVYGLVLAFTSYLILYTINPDLVSRLDINLDPITPQQRTDGGPTAGLGCAADGDQDCASGFKCVAFKCVPN